MKIYSSNFDDAHFFHYKSRCLHCVHQTYYAFVMYLLQRLANTSPGSTISRSSPKFNGGQSPLNPRYER